MCLFVRANLKCLMVIVITTAMNYHSEYYLINE